MFWFAVLSLVFSSDSEESSSPLPFPPTNVTDMTTRSLTCFSAEQLSAGAMKCLAAPVHRHCVSGSRSHQLGQVLFLQGVANVIKRTLMYLRDAPLGDAERARDVFETHVMEVVQVDHLALPSFQARDDIAQAPLCLLVRPAGVRIDDGC